MAEPSTILEPSAPPSADEGLMDDGGEGAAGNADAVWVKFADGSVDELDREVRAQGGGEEPRRAHKLKPPPHHRLRC